MSSAREVAVRTLAACEKQGAWSDGYLKRVLRENQMDSRDAALATRICFGVLQNQLLLDWHLARFCSSPLEKLDLNVCCVLRAAAYQLIFLDKIPASAAVNEAVNLTKKLCRNPRAAGMVNAVLRAMLRAGELPAPEGRDAAERLSILYSHPRWLVEEFLDRLGPEGTEALLAADNAQPPTTIQVNTCKTTATALAESLDAQGVTVTPHPWLENCLELTGTGDLSQLPAFQEGLFYVQDAAARLAVTALELRAGTRVLDCCAAPGGKSFAAAIDLENRGEVRSCDIHPHKIKLLEAGRDRLGLTIVAPLQQSAAQRREDWVDGFGAVLCDVPCSGLGIIRKKPDIRYKDPAPMANLPRVQREILDNCCAYVRPGGTLLYATCTLLRRENEAVVEEFLATHPGFALTPLALPIPGGESGMMTFWPHIHSTDGFFAARLTRKV